MIFRMLVAGAALGVALALAAPAEAKKMVYSPVVEEGEKEIEYYVDWHEDGDDDVVAHELAYEYGFAPKDMIAFYGVWEGVSGEDPGFTKYKIEWIHQVFEQGERAWDFATYFEYQIRDKGDADKVELKALFEKTLPTSTVTLNGVLEKEIGAEAGTEGGYAARWALRKWPNVAPALEAYGEVGEITNMKQWDDQPHIVGPAVDLRLGRATTLHLGALFGVTDGSEDVRVTSQVAYEWY